MRNLAKFLALAVLVGLLPFACTEAPDQLQGPDTPSSSILTSVMNGTEQLGDPNIPIEEGTGLVARGKGLRAGPGDIVFEAGAVPNGAEIKQVLVYWEGYNLDESGDDQILVDSNPVTGMKIGGTTEFWPDNWSTSYRADITSMDLINNDGTASTINIGGMDFNKPNGAGILVIYDDGSTNEVAGIKDGNDLAYWRFEYPLNITEWITFTFDPAGEDRVGSLTLFASSAEARPSVIEVDCGAGVMEYADRFDDNDGEKWDTEEVEVTVPANCTSLDVRVLSKRLDSSILPNTNPVSIAWICAALEIPTTEVTGCRMTGGCNDKYNTGDGWDVYTCGGQAGAPLASQPQPYGEWTHTQKRGPSGAFTFHAGTASAPPGTEIDWIECMDPGWCRQARPAPAKQLDFAGVGTFKNMKDCPESISNYVVVGESFHWFEVNVDDLGEPGKSGHVNPPADQCDPMGYGRNSQTELADCECPDFYRIMIHQTADPASPVMYEVYGYIDGGNFQIHPPTGRDRKSNVEG